MALELNGTTGVSLVQDGVITDANLPAGSVLQVVNATYATEVSSSSSTYADIGLTATITPTSATSKILVLINLAGCGKNTSDTRLATRLIRGATEIVKMDSTSGANASSTQHIFGSVSTSFLDSPSTTSATTYKVQFASTANTAGVIVNAYTGGSFGVDSSTSTITLMEIAG